MNLILSGAYGFMGREVAAKALQEGDTILFGIDPGCGTASFPVYPDFESAPSADGVIIDFSSPAALNSLLSYSRKFHIPAVLCTTGYTEEQLAAIREASASTVLFRSANMSIGIALLQTLCREAASILGEDFDVEIIEAHHNRKLDAPSGTALSLYDAVKDVYQEPRAIQPGRSGRSCKRDHREIGIHAVRGGTVTGEHQVCFLGPSERITISHSAENRALFATGALRAAAYLYGRSNGLYSMKELVQSLREG